MRGLLTIVDVACTWTTWSWSLVSQSKPGKGDAITPKVDCSAVNRSLHSFVNAAGVLGRHRRTRSALLHGPLESDGAASTVRAVVEVAKSVAGWLPLIGLSLAAVIAAKNWQDHGRRPLRRRPEIVWDRTPEAEEETLDAVRRYRPSFGIARVGRDLVVDDALVEHLRAHVVFRRRDVNLLETLRNKARVWLENAGQLENLSRVIAGSVAVAFIPSDTEINAMDAIMMSGDRIREVNEVLAGKRTILAGVRWYDPLLLKGRPHTWISGLTRWWSANPLPVF